LLDVANVQDGVAATAEHSQHPLIVVGAFLDEVFTRRRTCRCRPPIPASDGRVDHTPALLAVHRQFVLQLKE
jgi:hypothetical protein